jgi:acyl-CoA thioester hydrolase
MSDRFELPLAITDADIDGLGHVNNVVYVRWAQDAAVAHWETLASAEDRAALAWVAIRHEVDYLHPARPGDAIVAATWVGTADAVRFERFVEILRQSDRKVLARTRTLWCPINRATGRVARVNDAVRAVFSRPVADAAD